MKRRTWCLHDAGDSGLPVLERIRKRRELDPAAEVEHDPFLLPDMKQAVERIRVALTANERILVFGDYDADGITGSTLLVSCLKDLGAWVGVRLPHRERDGYGLQAMHAEEAAELGVQLLITVDNGSTALPALERARELGLDVIVLDHHSLHGRRPPCHALVNPHCPGSRYPEQNLAAVGVVYKLCRALGWKRAAEGLDLVALGTVADMASLRGENRWLVKQGLELLRQHPRPGLQALMELPPRREIDSRLLGWQLGPRINSSGRLDDPMLAYHLLMARDPEEARAGARRLDQLNQQRRELQDAAQAQAEAAFSEGRTLPPVLVLLGADWHLGIVGLVAGRLAQHFERPAVVLSRATPDGRIRGSARSLPGYHITEAFARHAELLEEFGGHSEAAGLTLDPANYPAFAKALTRDAWERREDMHLPVLDVDTLVDPAELELPLVRDLQELEPFGTGNPPIQLGLEDVQVERSFSLSGGKHTKLWLVRNGKRVEAVWWNRSGLPDDLGYASRVDLVFAPQVNTWQGRSEVQLVVEDLRAAGALREGLVA